MQFDERAPFQIRDFPIALREEIVRAAKDADLTVSDFTAGIFIQAREAGWTRSVQVHNNPAANGLSNKQNTEIAQNIALLVGALCQLSTTKGVAQKARKAANQTLAQRIASYGIALPAPEPVP